MHESILFVHNWKNKHIHVFMYLDLCYLACEHFHNSIDTGTVSWNYLWWNNLNHHFIYKNIVQIQGPVTFYGPFNLLFINKVPCI